MAELPCTKRHCTWATVPRPWLASIFALPTLVGLTPIISLTPLVYTQQTFTQDRFAIDPMLTYYLSGTKLVLFYITIRFSSTFTHLEQSL